VIVPALNDMNFLGGCAACVHACCKAKWMSAVMSSFASWCRVTANELRSILKPFYASSVGCYGAFPSVVSTAV